MEIIDAADNELVISLPVTALLSGDWTHSLTFLS
jgi:hypothetical protein